MVPDYPLTFWLCAVVAIVFVGIAKAGFGGGIGIVATPLMAMSIPVTDAVALLLPLLMVCDVFAVKHYRTHFDRRSVKLLLPGAVLGIAVGSFFFGRFIDDQRVLQVGIGVLALGFVLFQILRRIILGALAGHRPQVAEGVLLGALSGFASTLVHAGAPPVSIFLLPQQLPRDLFVGTTVIFFAALNLLKVLPYYSLDLFTAKVLTTTLILSPLSYVGVKLGIYLNRRFTDLWFNRVVYFILTLMGAQLILGKNLLTLLT